MQTDVASSLTTPQGRFLVLLGLPAFGISLAYTFVTTYVPVLLDRVSGPVVVGALIGGEGVVALVVPALAGGWSDHVHTRLGRRLPFVLAGAVLAIAALVLLPVGPGSLTWVGICVGVFFIAYFVYYTPYQALYPDLVPRTWLGRSQGVQGGMRSAGLLLAMGTGGFWLGFWRPLPFVIGAAVVAVMTLVLVWLLRDRHHQDEHGGSALAVQGSPVSSLRLLRSAPIRRWAAANVCWEAAIGSLRTFVVLYFTLGLGLSLHETSASLALVGAAAIVAAPVSGRLADRYGVAEVMQVATIAFGFGVLVTVIGTSPYFVAAIVPGAFAAVVLITLPYTLLMELMPPGRTHGAGAGAGLFGLSRGVGVIAGPVLAGLTIEYTDTLDVLTLAETDGYAMCFVVTSAFLFLSLPLLRSLRAPAAVARG